MEIYQFESLLSQVKALNERYEKVNELTGENFNIFRILKLQSSEVRMHSAFLAELLNPAGSHGQKTAFLQLFMEMFCFKGNNLDLESCKVNIEKHAGFISEDGTEGGRIDIIITDKHNTHVIIENKIYAGDQSNQLLRYYNYSPKADLIYLTLDGKEPGESSRGHLQKDEHFKCISYKADIVSWLEKCRKEVAILPIIRESITQYLNLIKYLTNQTINDTMKKELSTIIVSNLEASFLIADNLDNSLKLLEDKLDAELQAIAEERGLEYSNGISWNENYSGLWFARPEWKYSNIGFQFQSYDKKLVYGIAAKKDPDHYPLELRTAIASACAASQKPNGWWPFYQPMEEPFDNWNKYEAWKAIQDGTMAQVLREKIDLMLEAVKGLEL